MCEPELIPPLSGSTARDGCREVQQLDLHTVEGDHLRPQLHRRVDLERPIETLEHLFVELVVLGRQKAETVTVEAQRRVDVGYTQADVRDPDRQNGRSPLIETRSITRRRW